jgi:hypothetical protein
MNDFAAHTSIQKMGEWGGVVKYGNDQNMVVMFYTKAVIDPTRSTEAGRPFYKDVVYVRVHPPGERLNIVDRQATQADKQRWATHWNQFRENAPQETEGTPIELLYPDSPAKSGALRASGVHTVEQLAHLSAHAIESIGMGAQHWVNDAARYLQVADKGVKASELKKMLDDRDRENDSLKRKITLLEEEIGHLRDNIGKQITMDDVQAMIANQGGGGRRGVYPQQREMRNSTFDPQAAQIAATHPTKDLSKARAPKRPRSKISG